MAVQHLGAKVLVINLGAKAPTTSYNFRTQKMGMRPVWTPDDSIAKLKTTPKIWQKLLRCLDSYQTKVWTHTDN
jgi:hypothetical protein